MLEWLREVLLAQQPPGLAEAVLGLVINDRGQAWSCRPFLNPNSCQGTCPHYKPGKGNIMIADQIVAGIDVSKDRLDVFILPQKHNLSVPNTPSGLAGLVRQLKRFGVPRVALEASGGYERTARDRLTAAGFCVHLLAPQRVRALARAMGRHAKTDPIDAQMIAQFVLLSPDLRAQQTDPVLDRLTELAGLRRQLLAERNRIVSRLDRAQDATIKRLLNRALSRCKADLIFIEAEIKAHITTTHLNQRYRQLLAIDGIGPVLATALLCDLPELGSASSKQLASLVGVAPHARQSGRTQKSGKCFGGRTNLRNVLYMATLSTLKAKMPHLRPFFDRPRANGKPFKLAITATMRKFITIINAIIKAQNQTQT